MELRTEAPPGSRLIAVRGVSPRSGASVVVARALVSEEDYLIAASYSWSMAGRGYARAAGKHPDGRFRSVYLHRLVMGDPKGLQIDHRNGDKLDCRRENLRQATNSQNHAGYSSRPPGESGHRGVTLDKRRGTYNVRVTVLGKAHRRHGFKTIEEAVKVRNELGREIHGEHYFEQEEK